MILFEVPSTKTLDAIEAGLQEAAQRHKFGILAIHDLQETMRKKGVEFDRQVRIYEVCNPHQAKRVLEANGSISTALPCRISVYRDGDGFRIATLKPTVLLGMFGEPALAPVAEEVEAVLVDMISSAA